ncbi:MAG: TIR domain-containing protein [Methanosphaera sp.]|nr:TIR domain-containing protein [Methanosphaera sp.]
MNNISNLNIFISYYHVDKYFKDKLSEIVSEHFKTNSSPHKYEICHDFKRYTDELRKTASENNVFIVLVGNETYKSRNVDWEIDFGLHENACMLGLCLPTNDDYLKKDYNPKIIPEKLATNIYAGYAGYFDWTENYDNLEQYIDISLNKKMHKHALLV